MVSGFSFCYPLVIQFRDGFIGSGGAGYVSQTGKGSFRDLFFSRGGLQVHCSSGGGYLGTSEDRCGNRLSSGRGSIRQRQEILKYNTYLEKAFLGFLLAGTIWVHGLPENLAHFFVNNSVALLYFTLFLMSFLPQLIGHEPFTYAIAKQWHPESVWRTPDFRLINYRITYVWSGVFFACFLSSYLGKEKPAYAIFIPFALCIGIGVAFSRKYPDFYLKKKYRVSPEATAAIPDSVDKLIEGMPSSFNPAAASDLRAEIQFDVRERQAGDGLFPVPKAAARFVEERRFPRPLPSNPPGKSG